MKLVIRAAAASAVAAALILATSPGASAGTSFGVNTNGDHSRGCDLDAGAGSAQFFDDGEIIYLSDNSSDGYGIGVDVYVSGKLVDTLTNTGGVGEKKFNMSYAEGRKVTMNVWGGDGNRVCGGNSDSGVA